MEQIRNELMMAHFRQRNKEKKRLQLLAIMWNTKMGIEAGSQPAERKYVNLGRFLSQPV
jgi:hypothetical protein